MKLTREGKGLIVTGVLVAMAALNTGNNLIYLLTALMLALGILDVAAGWFNLRKISGDADVEEPVYAEEELSVTFRFLNERKHGTSFLVKLLDPAAGLSATAPRIAPDSMTTIRSQAVFRRRGRVCLSEMKLVSGYPFGFYQNSRNLKNPKHFLVYPKLMDVRNLLEGSRGMTADGVLPHPAGEDFTDIRPYRQGDPMRDIHWKATAKSGHFMVKEFRAGISRQVTVALDSGVEADMETLEKGISLAASLVDLFFSDGIPVRLLTPGAASTPARSREQFYHIMDMLALLQREAVDAAFPPVEAGEAVFVILCSRNSPFRKLAQGAAGVFDAAAL
ncbi:MAG: DUF58 domain-containing protein [Acidobacteria bacterium]|nr:DUF58 domain-containing protein [Acidobacteriota bacterium]